MGVRKIVKIDEEKCNGCGECVTSCVEGAIKIIDGKARLVSDSYCDGLGACLGHCPQDAITVEERDAVGFDEKAAMQHMAQSSRPQPQACGCPSSQARTIHREKQESGAMSSAEQQSCLATWPVQLKLVSPHAPFLKDSHLLLAADCVPFVYANFHGKMLQGRPVVIACPKLDDISDYVQKLSDIIKLNGVKSLTVVHMEVPCCSGLVRIAQAAAAMSGTNVPIKEITVMINGDAFDNFGSQI